MNLIKLSNLNFDSRYVTWKFNDNDMFLYTNRPLLFLGKGGYGNAYKILDTNLVVKYIKYDGKSERLSWMNEHNEYNEHNEHNEHKGIETINQENAFIYDIKYESEIQEKVNSNIYSIDGTPITPAIINSFVLKKKGKQYAFIFMEYCDGIPFNSILFFNKDGAVISNSKYNTIHIYKSIKFQLETLLEKLHSLDIVHGDLLGNNIIIQFKDNIPIIPIVKIIDFGQASSLDLYRYYYHKEIRHKIRPDEETYRVFNLLDKAIQDIQDDIQDHSFKFKYKRNLIRTRSLSSRKSRK